MPPVPPGGRMTNLALQAQQVAGVGFNQDQNGGAFVYGPGAPLDPVSDNNPVRVLDFPPGYNLSPTPRTGESFSFAELRAFANVELVRLAIETRKDQIERLDWKVRPILDRRRRGAIPQEAYPAQAARVKQVENFLRKPDGIHLFSTWIRLLMEDLLAIDAVALEVRRNRVGQLIGLDPVPGDTVHILIDATGRRPLAPLPAYQQIIRGTVYNNLTAEELLYLPRNVRPGHVYGMSPVQQIIVTINTVLGRQTQQLAYFSAGNTPEGIINAPDGWTAEQLKAYQQWFDEYLAGNATRRSGVLWVPFGAKYQSFKEAPLQDHFDEWLARIVSFAFSLPPTPFIRAMNRSASETDKERALTEGMEPLLLWAKRFLDDIIQTEWDPDLEFVWDPPRDIDPSIQAAVDDSYLRNGTKCVDEVREEIGLEPITGGDVARIYLAEGPVRLDLLDRHAEARLEALNASAARSVEDKAPATRSGGSSPKNKGDGSSYAEAGNVDS
jgi:HK97 family phage portal protein